MIPFRKSIGFRIFSISFILLAIPVLIDAFVLIHEHYAHRIVNAKQYLVNTAGLRELLFSEIHPSSRNLLKMISSFLDLENNFPNKPVPEINEKLAKMAKIGDFSSIAIIAHTADLS